MIVDKCRDKTEFYNLHGSCDQERLPNPNDILALTTYRCFYDEDTKELLGCIYLEDEDGKLMLSGFSKRDNYKNIIEAIRFILDLNPTLDIYSRTTKLNAKIVLRHAGFKKIDSELYIRKAVA